MIADRHELANYSRDSQSAIAKENAMKSNKSKSSKSAAPVVTAPVAPIVEAPKAPETAPTTSAVIVKRVMQSIVVGAETAHDEQMKSMTARVHALNLGRDLFGARLNSRTEAVNTALMLATAPQSVKLLEARSLAKNVSNDLRAKSNGAITVVGADGAKTAPVVVHELGAWRLSDDALRIVKRYFSDAPCLVMLKETAPEKIDAIIDSVTDKAPVKSKRKSK